VRYSLQQLERLWVEAGGSRADARVMAAIALAESRGDPRATDHDSNGTVDRGLWQINSVHGYSASSSFNALQNARQAVAVFRSQGLRAWTTYTSGAYQKYLKPGSTPGLTGDEIVKEARQYVGDPYKWGGTTPAGFDCSGFAQYLYQKNGIDIPRTTYEQYQTGTAVPFRALEPGDLVFYKGSDSQVVHGKVLPGHVGVYIGNGKIIDAFGTGSGVRVQNVNDPSLGGYVGARRYAQVGNAPPVTASEHQATQHDFPGFNGGQLPNQITTSQPSAPQQSSVQQGAQGLAPGTSGLGPFDVNTIWQQIANQQNASPEARMFANNSSLINQNVPDVILPDVPVG